MSAAPDPRLKADQITVNTLDTPLDKEVKVLGSKSYTNRYIAIAALSGKPTVIDGALLSDDTQYLTNAVTAFGHVRTAIDHEAARITIEPTGEPMRAPAEEIFVGGAGTPLRFQI